MIVGSMYSSVPLSPALHASVFLSTVYLHFRQNQLSLYVNLVCFDSILAQNRVADCNLSHRLLFSGSRELMLLCFVAIECYPLVLLWI